ncbi:MAG: hypothetical protein V1809_06820, partial [Planctomycetota bacterium]
LAVLRHHQGDHLLLGKVLKCCNFHVEYYRPAGEKSASDFSGRERLRDLERAQVFITTEKSWHKRNWHRGSPQRILVPSTAMNSKKIMNILKRLFFFPVCTIKESK